MSIESRPLVIGLGEVLWDLLPSGAFLGGAPANFAFHANQLGANGLVVSAIGRDPCGQEIQSRFRELGLSTAGQRLVDRPTGTVTGDMQEGQPNYTIHTDVAWDEIPCDADLEAVARRAAAVCFGSLAQRSLISRDNIRKFLAATGKGCLKVCDINLRQHYYDVETLRTSLELCDVLKLNHEEFPILAKLLDLPESIESGLAETVSRFQLRLAVVTRGANGSSLIGPWRVSDHPGYPVSAIADTVGAGDAFTAAIVWGLLHEEDLDRLHARAARIASFVCTQSGATPQVPADVMR